MGNIVMNSEFDLPHFYPRYGLAVALVEKGIKPDAMTEEDARIALAEAIEAGLERFRIRTLNNPETDAELEYDYIKAYELRDDKPLLYSKGLRDKGVYLAPTILTNELNKQQAQTIPDTFNKARQIAADLRSSVALTITGKLNRSFAPMTAERNNGSLDSKSPTGTLFERACCAVATLTEWKAAAKVEKCNTAIFPDLSLGELYNYIKLFKEMLLSEGTVDLKKAKLRSKPTVEAAKQPKKRGKKVKEKGDGNKEEEEKSKYNRPLMCYGNYPEAPRLSGVAPFGGSGLLAAIGKWARRYGGSRLKEAREVLESIAGTEDLPGRPLYLVSYAGVNQENYSHYIVDLALEQDLSSLIYSLMFGTRIYGDMGKEVVDRKSNEYRLFYLLANRFLQQFTASAFSDFFSTRAEYPSNIQPLFEVYFMKKQEISKEIVNAAVAYGQWLNRVAYHTASSMIKADSQTGSSNPKKVQEAKAKILIELESAMMSAKTPQEMLGTLAGRTLRLMQPEAPTEAIPFMVATSTGEIDPTIARHLVMAFTRVSASRRTTNQNVESDDYPEPDTLNGPGEEIE